MSDDQFVVTSGKTHFLKDCLLLSHPLANTLVPCIKGKAAGGRGRGQKVSSQSQARRAGCRCTRSTESGLREI